MPPAPVLLWLRRDLRLADHPALAAAAGTGAAVVPVYVHDPESVPGEAARIALHHALAAFDRDLRRKGARLVFLRGRAAEALPRLARRVGARRLFATRAYGPEEIRREQAVLRAWEATGGAATRLGGALLAEPWDLQTRSGGPYRVFTPFWKRFCASVAVGAPLPGPERLPPVPEAARGVRLVELGLLPRGERERVRTLGEAWPMKAEAVDAALARFVRRALAAYPHERDRPDRAGTSRLSPYLAWGRLSPRQVWHTVRRRAADGRTRVGAEAAEAFLRQLGWREFAYHLLFHYPQTPQEPLDPRFARLRWREAEAERAAWEAGRTGVPLVDAGMRELRATGWMHNRVRMVVASFLSKDLLLPWQAGAEVFLASLVDADPANNTLGWQWAAGCGADAQPFFRIFHPARQAVRFDPEGAYIRRWVPELADLPTRWLPAPHEAPAEVLDRAGVRLGRTYPPPLVEHDAARRRALEAFARVRG